MRVLTKFLTSAADPRQFPKQGPPEIAFLGRSNVGKSSVINSLVGSKIAKTSSTPGRTQTINFFEIRRPGQPRPDCLFADLPGYGYARVPKEVSEKWAEFIDPYLQKRDSLALCICIVDVSIPPQANDLQLLEWLRRSERPFIVVATKADRVSGNELTRNVQRLMTDLAVPRVIPYSTKTGTGMNDLWKAISKACQPQAGEEAVGE